MDRNDTKPNNHPNVTVQDWASLTASLTVPVNSQSQQVTTHAQNDNKNDHTIQGSSSQPISLKSWDSSTSFGSTSSDVKRADVVFDKIEDLLYDFMRDSSQHYLHCRVLRWSYEEDPSRIFNAVVVVNPPFTKI